jgi:hypothetical protein
MKMTAKVATFSLRLPLSLKAAIEKLAAAEKLAAIQTAKSIFAARSGLGDKAAAIRFLTRPAGEAPRPDDDASGRCSGHQRLPGLNRKATHGIDNGWDHNDQRNA